MTRVEKALKSARETRALRIGHGILTEITDMFAEQFPDRRAVVVADTITYRVAGKEVCRLLDAAGIGREEPFIFTDPGVYGEYSYVEMLAESLKTHNAIPVAVGSGTINDLTKLASHLSGRPYMCVATAASMDGYTAFGASITANGAKQTFNCPAPQACLADIDVIGSAPIEMTASGYADLLAKVTAGADWILADGLGVELIDKEAWDIVQTGLHETLSNPQGIRNGDPKALYGLIEGLMLGGFAMQSFESSRPASGAEHQFSHLWNMEHHKGNNGSDVISHGFQVAIGTLAVAAMYEELFKMEIEELDVEACCRAWPTPEELHREAAEIFKNTDFPEIGVQETAAKYISADDLAIQLQKLKENWGEIKQRLEGQLMSYDDMKSKLRQIGAPYEPEQIGVSREYLRDSFIRAQYIRRRFTVLDLIIRTNMYYICLEKLFGKGGIWEI